MFFWTETYMIRVNVFYVHVVRNEFSAGSDKRQIISPWNPIVKIAHFVYRHDVTKGSDFYNWGLWGKFSLFVRSSWNFVPEYVKHVLNISCKCQLGITSIKQFIAKNRLTNLYEINSRSLVEDAEFLSSTIQAHNSHGSGASGFNHLPLSKYQLDL